MNWRNIMINSLSLYGNLRYGQEYDLYTDGELIKKFNVGNEQAEKCMLKRYFYLIRRIVNSFYIRIIFAVKNIYCKYQYIRPAW